MFSKDIGIDLGTANTLIFMKGKGIIMREPSVVAVDTRNDTVRYVGQDAKEVIGRTPGSIVAVRPLKDGVIADFDITASMLQIFIRKVCNNSVLDAIRTTLEKTPPELSADIIDHGITLTGGGALLRGLDQLIEKETGMPVHIAESPLDCVAMGTGRVLDDIDRLRDLLADDAKSY